MTKCKNGFRNYLFYANEECSIFNCSNDDLIGNNIQFNDKIINFNGELLSKLFFGNNRDKKDNFRNIEKNENLNPKIININNEKQLKNLSLIFLRKIYIKRNVIFLKIFLKGLWLLFFHFRILFSSYYFDFFLLL